MKKLINCKGLTQKVQMERYNRARDTKLGSGAMFPLYSSRTIHNVCRFMGQQHGYSEMVIGLIFTDQLLHSKLEDSIV